MTDVAVVGFAQAPSLRHGESTTSGVEMLVPIFQQVLKSTGLAKDDIGFWCSGSSDYLAGRAFSFVQAVDAIGAFPPVMESHVEMDGAWALYEARLKIRTGEVETALVYGFGKSSAGNLRRVLSLQLDPYLHAPLWPDSVSVAALQARLGIEAGIWSEKEMAEKVLLEISAKRLGHTGVVNGGGGVVGLDFAERMLERARAKEPAIEWVQGDVLALPFPDASFDAATVGFGVRNVEDLEAGLRGLRRVLRPGGRLAILEIPTPRGPLAPFYRLWFDRAIPLLGRVLPGGAAYTYLPASVRRFPEPEALVDLLAGAGFASVRFRRFAGGIVALHVGEAGE